MPRLRRSDHVGDANPALPGWADVWRAALRASIGLGPRSNDSILQRVARTDGRGFQLPGSNAAVSSPSPLLEFHLSTPLRSVEKHFQERSAELQIPPQRYPGFPVDLGGVVALHAPFFTEGRTRGFVQCRAAGNPGSLRSELVTFLIWPVVCGWKARKSICQQASPGSFDCAP